MSVAASRSSRAGPAGARMLGRHDDRPRLRSRRPAARAARPVGDRPSMPSLRPGPPYHMTEMIAAEPGVARRLLDVAWRPPAPAAAARRGRSAQAARGRRAGRRHRLRHVRARGARRRRDPARGAADRRPAEPRRDRQRPGVRAVARPADAAASSSASPTRAATTATNAALAAAARAGRADGARHGQRRSPGGGPRRHRRRDRRARPELVPHRRLPQPDPRRGGRRRAPVRAGPLDAGCRRPISSRRGVDATSRGAEADRRRASPTRATLIVIASGADRPAGRELVLKVEEASWLPSAYRDLETFLHGHLPATGRDDRRSS